MKAFTDYPIVQLGDVSGAEAPIRECEILEYDDDKYCLIRVESVEIEVKSGYLYTEAGRCGDVPRVPITELTKLVK